MRKTSKLIRFSLASSLLALVVVSLLLGSNPFTPFCPLNRASAQDSPCLAEEVTINAQQAQILELQGTNVAQKVQLLQAQGMNAALQATANAYTPGFIITVPIVLSSTPATLIILPTLSPEAPVQIADVVGTGELTLEGVEIRNLGNVLDLTDWTLSDEDGNIYTFPQQRLFTNSLITVYSRVGDNTPIALYWGRTTPVWSAGEVATLADSRGTVQSLFKVK